MCETFSWRRQTGGLLIKDEDNVLAEETLVLSGAVVKGNGACLFQKRLVSIPQILAASSPPAKCLAGAHRPAVSEIWPLILGELMITSGFGLQSARSLAWRWVNNPPTQERRCTHKLAPLGRR